MPRCRQCEGPVDGIAVALNLKIVSRQATEFLCLRCLAETFRTTEEALLEAADRYRRAGCILFPTLPPSGHSTAPGGGVSRG